jgi:List-Bact-rpt repeat protein
MPSRRTNRTPLLLLATTVSVALGLGVAGAGRGATGADQVALVVDARAIDGSLLFSTAAGWQWRCTVPGAQRCTVRAARGAVISIAGESGARSSFLRWEDGCAGYGTQSACTLQLNADAYVTARFSPLRLSLPVFGRGSVLVETTRPRRSCGLDCWDIAFDDTVVIRPRELQGWRFTGWGSKCETIRRDCHFSMRGNYTAAATFEPVPPAIPCPVNASCDPVTPSQTFVLSVSGPGKVVAQGLAPYPATVCEATTAAPQVCQVRRPAKKTLVLRAITGATGRFVGWGDRCRSAGGNTECSFYNGPGPNGAPRITAAFS